MAKKPTRKKAHLSRIATKIIPRMSEVRASKVVDLRLFRQIRDFALQGRAKSTERLDGFHPVHARVGRRVSPQTPPSFSRAGLSAGPQTRVCQPAITRRTRCPKI